MHTDLSPRTRDLRDRVDAFMREHVFPSEPRYDAELEENARRNARWTPPGATASGWSRMC